MADSLWLDKDDSAIAFFIGVQTMHVLMTVTSSFVWIVIDFLCLVIAQFDFDGRVDDANKEGGREEWNRNWRIISERVKLVLVRTLLSHSPPLHYGTVQQVQLL